jgi:hypothetical protein
MRHIVLAVLVVMSTAVLAQEDQPVVRETPAVTEFRKHFEVVDGTGAVLYTVSAIVRFSEASAEDYVLVRDEGYGDYVLRNVWTFKDQISNFRISDVKDRVFLQVTYKFPFASKTRSATLEEGHRFPHVTDAGVPARIETNGGRWDGAEHDWDEGARLRAFRHQLRQTVDFSLIEAIDRMRGTLFTTDAASTFYFPLCKYAVYDDVDPAESTTTGNDEGAASTVKTRDRAPDCDFDAHFGFKCSEKQLALVKRAAKEEKALVSY